MGLDHQSSGLLIALGNLVAMTATWLLMPILNRWSLQKTGIGVLIYAALTMSATAWVTNKTTLFIWGALIGGCISTMGSLSNLFVQNGISSERRGQLMSALHSLYGLSSFFAPWVAGIVLEHPEKWRLLFTSLTPMALGLAFFVHRYGPDRSQNNPQPTLDRPLLHQQPLSLRAVHVLSISVLISYVVAEVLTSTWMASYLVSQYHVPIRDASWYTSLFFATMLITRVACSLWAKPRWHRAIIWCSAMAGLTCFLLARLTGWLWLLPLVGLIGPFFPLYVTWVSLRFPERDRSMVIWMLAGMQGALFGVNLLMGTLADDFGFGVAFWAPALFLTLTLILLKWSQDVLSP
jgi:fucose permease